MDAAAARPQRTRVALAYANALVTTRETAIGTERPFSFFGRRPEFSGPDMECLVVADAGIEKICGCRALPRLRGRRDGDAAVTDPRWHASPVRKARFPTRRGNGREVSRDGTCH
jgi:hypothetical protein